MRIECCGLMTSEAAASSLTFSIFLFLVCLFWLIVTWRKERKLTAHLASEAVRAWHCSWQQQAGSQYKSLMSTRRQVARNGIVGKPVVTQSNYGDMNPKSKQSPVQPKNAGRDTVHALPLNRTLLHYWVPFLFIIICWCAPCLLIIPFTGCVSHNGNKPVEAHFLKICSLLLLCFTDT